MKFKYLINPEITTKELVACYNALSEKPVKKFADRKSAIRRVQSLLDDKAESLSEDDKDPEDLWLVSKDITEQYIGYERLEEFKLVPKQPTTKAADRPVDLTEYDKVTEASNSFKLEGKLVSDKNCCIPIAICLLTGISYGEVYDALKEAGRKHGRGTSMAVWKPALKSLGYKVKSYNLSKQISKYPGCHGVLLSNVTSFHPKRFPEFFPSSMPNLLCTTASHGFAMIDGETKDWCHEKYLRIKDSYTIEKA